MLLGIGFVALGVWQLERRVWKLALIERVTERVHADPADAPGPERWSAVRTTDDEYRHVRATGTWLTESTTFVVAVTEYGRGYWALVPLRSPDGAIVIVNRGFVAARGPLREAASRPVVVTGLLRITEPRGTVLHDNDPGHDRWYSRDVQAIARVRGLERVAPYFIDADAASAGEQAGAPIGGLTVIAFRNDHLVYAITWFILASMCAEAARRLLKGRPRPYEEDR